MADRIARYLQSTWCTESERSLQAIITLTCCLQAANPTSAEPKFDLGHERPKSGPTTNFVGKLFILLVAVTIHRHPRTGFECKPRYCTKKVCLASGNHMTQGAIDLAQAELMAPVKSALSLLQNKPCLEPRLLDAQPAQAQKSLLQPIAKYTWWDSKTQICISIPVRADISTKKLDTGQVQCDIQQQQLHCTITSRTAHQLIQHRLSIPHLHACVQPGRSTCLLDGQAVLLEHNRPTPPPGVSRAHDAALQSRETIITCSLLQQCKSSSKASTQARNTSIAANHQPSSSTLRSSSARNLQPLALQPAAIAPACISQVLIRLTKADPSQPWETLTQPPPLSQPCKLAAASEESMAALRRTLIHRRQQTQAQQGKPVGLNPYTTPPACNPVATPLSAVAPTAAVDLTEAAVALDDKLLQALQLTSPAESHSLPAHCSSATSSTDCRSAVQRILPDFVQVWQCYGSKDNQHC